MGIGKVGGYGSPSEYQGKLDPQQSVKKPQTQEESRRLLLEAGDHSLSAGTALTEKPYPSKAPQQKPLEDISLTFLRQKDYEYLGNEEDIRNLDMQKAISDMKKDQVLQQYQYFVGSSQNVFGDLGDGIVIPKL